MNHFFKGLNIFIVPVGLGLKRTDFFEKQIKNHGGVVIKEESNYEDITHAVFEETTSLVRSHCLSALTSVNMKLCDNIKYLSIKWVSQCLATKRLINTSQFELNCLKTTLKGESLEPDSLIDAEFRLKRNSEDVPVLDRTKKLKVPDTEKSLHSDAHVSTQTHQPDCNEEVICQLQKLSDVFHARGDTWRYLGYDKAINAIKRHNKPITTFQEANSVQGVSEKMALKIMEVIETGKIQKVEEVCNSENAKVLDLFYKVWGVGPTTAEQWYHLGYRTLDDLRTKATLTKQQVIGLKYFDAIQQRIPREEVEEVGEVVRKCINTIDSGIISILVGSYRRGSSTCGDIDVMVVNNSAMKPSEILTQTLDKLKTTGFIIDDLVTIEEVGAQRKYLGMCQLPGNARCPRRLDIFVVPHSEYATALMHYTGSALFNRSIRLLASKKNMSLSEHSLCKNVMRKGMEKLNDGEILPTPTEASIFKHLELEYRPPTNRNIW